MRNTISRATIAGLAALSLMGSLVATSEPAAAQFHGGGRGGGFHGGGGWHGGGWHRGGGWAGPAIVGGLAAGALLAAPYAYGYGYGPYGYGGYGYGYGGCRSYAPIYDAYGNYIGQQPVYGC
jgi:hypothetical protein